MDDQTSTTVDSTPSVLWSKYASGWGFSSAVVLGLYLFFGSDSKILGFDGMSFMLVLIGSIIFGFAYTAVMSLVGWVSLKVTRSIWVLGLLTLSAAVLPLTAAMDWNYADTESLVLLGACVVPTVGALAMFARRSQGSFANPN